MIATLTTALIAATLVSAQAPPMTVAAKHGDEGIEVRWFPPAPTERGERWGYRVERIDSAGNVLPITHMPLQFTLNVATLRDRLGPFAETFLGIVAQDAESKRINENVLNDALMAPVSRAQIVRYAVLYPEIADALGWRRIDQDLQPGKSYTYRVVAVDRSARGGETTLGEARATAARAPTAAPKSARVSQPTSDRLVVSWPRDQAREQADAIVRYVVHRRDEGGPWIALTSGLTSPVQPALEAQGRYVDASVLPGRSYQYAVSAIDLIGRESTKTTTGTMRVSDQRPPPPPLDVELVDTGDKVTLSWLVAGLPEDVAGIEILRVRRDAAEGGPRRIVKVMAKVGPTTNTFAMRRPGLGHHEFALRAYDGQGNRGPLSVAVGIHIDRAVRLKTPSGVRAKLNKDGQVEVAWTPPFGTDAVSYVVERRVANMAGPALRISPSTVGSRDKLFIDSHPPLEGAPLAYRVVAVDGASARSAPSPWVTLEDFRRAPAAHLAPVTRSAKGVHLSWRVASSPVASGFRLQVQVEGGRWTTLPGKALAPSQRALIDSAKRAPESLVRYRLESLGGASGAPIYSNIVTLRHGDATIGPVQGLAARCTKEGVALSWSKSAGASAYELHRSVGSAPFSTLGQTSALRWQDRTAVSAKRYRYRLVGLHGLTMSAPNEPVELLCSPH